jgi:phospholipid-binding lipoprotein MlaA
VGAGPYIVLPVLGPSNARDTVGRAARMASDPRTYMPDAWSYSLIGAEFVQYKADNLENLNLLDSSSLDKYGFMRTVYMQRRESLVNSGRAAAGAP